MIFLIKSGRDFSNSARDSGVVARGAGTHPRPRENLVSRGLTNLREEDLRLLSVLTRRAFEGPV
jgi:hypothetical protein